MTEMKTPRKWPWMKALLILSLGMNLAVAGLVVGAKMSGHGRTQSKAHLAGGSGLRIFVRSLPKGHRSEVRRYFRINRTKIHTNGKAMHEATQTIHVAITARPFKTDALHAAFAAQRLHITTSTQDAQKALVAIISGMTDDQRLAYVNAMKEQRRKWLEKHPRKQRK